MKQWYRGVKPIRPGLRALLCLFGHTWETEAIRGFEPYQFCVRCGKTRAMPQTREGA